MRINEWMHKTVSFRRMVPLWRKTTYALLTSLYLMMVIPGCGKKQKGEVPSDVLMELGDSALTATMVNARIPTGISPEDSAALFHKIVETWLQDMLLTDMAEERIDNLDEIEEKVNAYRRQLIMAQFLRKIRDNGRRVADKESVRNYYESHSSEMKLESPLVKGIYVKVASNSDRLDDIRKWVRSATDASVDNLEKYGLGQALQYDYFQDKWLDWQTLSEAIPYRFDNPEKFLSSLAAPGGEPHKEWESSEYGKSKGFFEIETDGAIYLLHISTWLPAGSEIPYEFASRRIASMLEEQSALESQQKLLASLFQRAKKEKRLRLINYDRSINWTSK